MKLKLFAVLTMLFCMASFAHAQRLGVTAGAHFVSLTYSASSTAGASYNVWRAPCSVAISGGLCPSASEGTFAKITATPITALTYTDSSVSGNTNYSYYVTAICPPGACAANFTVNQDSVPSNHVGAAVPPDPVGPPSGLTLTNIASNHQGSNESVYVAWTDTPGSTTSYTLANLSKTLQTGKAFSSTGVFWAQWAGSNQTGLSLKACDSIECITWPVQ